MIRLVRNKLGLKIVEFRYPEILVEEKGFDMIKIYSFKDFSSPGWIKVPQCSMMIDLTKSEEELFSNMNKNYQKQVRREEREEIKIKMAKSEEESEKFYKERYLDLCKRENLKPYPYQYIKQGELWYAENKEGKMISGSVIFHDDEYATQSFTASEHLEYNGNRLLIWTAINYYKNKGLKWFNFGGGESDYKRRFGSTKFDVWTYVKYISLKARILNNVRNLIKFRKDE